MDSAGTGKAGGAGRRRLSAEERRETILAAASEVFAGRGYRGTRMSEVAARIEVSEPVIFQNFGSKAALYAAVLERAAGQVRAHMHTAVAHQGSAAGLLAHVLDPSRHHGPHGPDGAESGALFSDAATLLTDPELTGEARQAVRAVVGHLADLVRQARADGDLPGDLDPEAGAWLLLSVLSTRRLRKDVTADGGALDRRLAGLVLGAIGYGTG